MKKYRDTRNTESDYLRCRKCGVVKELVADNFYKNKNRKTGFESQCKECQKKNDASWYQDNRKRILADKKEYYQNKKLKDIN